MQRERRLRVISMSVEELLNLHAARRDGSCMILAESEGLPEDAEIVNISHDAWRYCLEVVICSKTFDIVPEGMVVPRHDQNPLCHALKKIPLSEDVKCLFLRGDPADDDVATTADKLSQQCGVSVVACQYEVEHGQMITFTSWKDYCVWRKHKEEEQEARFRTDMIIDDPERKQDERRTPG